MAPLPSILEASTRAAYSTPVGGNESAVSVNTVIAFLAMGLATSQGFLVMESADPCRISYKKWKLLVILEALEVGMVVASEALSFNDLRAALRERLQWLHWLPPCLLALGLLELLIDVWWTLYMGVCSRMIWLPFSSVGYVPKKKYKGVRSLVEVAPMIATALLSLVLVGFRARWWLVHAAVGETRAREAALANRALSERAIGVCVGWGLFIACLSFVFLIIVEIYTYVSDGGEDRYQSVFGGFWGSWNPREYFDNHPDQTSIRRDPKAEDFKRQDTLHRIQFGEELGLTQQMKERKLKTAELHTRNAIQRRDNSRVFDSKIPAVHVAILLVEHFTILPLQCSVVAALFQLHDKLDLPTYTALKELVDAVVVVALVELAIGFKAWLWGYGYVDEVHKNDRTLGEPLGDDVERGCLRCWC